MDQKRLGALNQEDERTLSYPMAPVIEKTGNQAARATPICAFAAAMARSALPTSGRRSRSLDGSPADTGGGVPASSPGSSEKPDGILPNRTAIACSSWARSNLTE